MSPAGTNSVTSVGRCSVGSSGPLETVCRNNRCRLVPSLAEVSPYNTEVDLQAEIVIRPHRMPEMWTIVVNDPVSWASVSLSCDFSVQTWLNRLRSSWGLN